MLAAHGAPDQAPVARVEFLDAAIGLDDLGPDTLMRPSSDTTSAEQQPAIRPPPP